jgi:hypothetical protein
MATRSTRKMKDYDDRFGTREYARDLKEDGEVPGLYTVDPDPEHPRRHPIVPQPDISMLAREKPAPHRYPADVIPGVTTRAILWEAPTMPTVKVAARSVPIEVGGVVVGASHGA